MCEKINIAIGVIYTCHRAARCGILFFVQKNVCRFQCLPLRCDPNEARIDGVANKKPLFNCVYILPIFPKIKEEGGPINPKKGISALLKMEGRGGMEINSLSPPMILNFYAPLPS